MSQKTRGLRWGAVALLTIVLGTSSMTFLPARAGYCEYEPGLLIYSVVRNRIDSVGYNLGGLGCDLPVVGNANTDYIAPGANAIIVGFTAPYYASTAPTDGWVTIHGLGVDATIHLVWSDDGVNPFTDGVLYASQLIKIKPDRKGSARATAQHALGTYRATYRRPTGI